MIQSSIYGRLGRDPKPGTTKTGNPMTTVSIAVDVGREPGEETLWVSLMAFGTQAELLERHQKGDMVAAMGKLTRGHYKAADGTDRESWSLLVEALHSSLTVRPGPSQGQRRQGEAPARESDRAPYAQGSEPPPFDDEIPF